LQSAKSYKLIFKKKKLLKKNEKQEKKSFLNNTRNFKLKKEENKLLINKSIYIISLVCPVIIFLGGKGVRVRVAA
jgi:hypothetical protein